MGCGGGWVGRIGRSGGLVGLASFPCGDNFSVVK